MNERNQRRARELLTATLDAVYGGSTDGGDHEPEELTEHSPLAGRIESFLNEVGEAHEEAQKP